MLPANDQDPFSPTENNISIVNKRRSILNASAGGIRWPYRKSFQSEQLHLLSESSSTNASSLHSTQGRIMIQPGFFFKAFFRRFRRKKSEALIPSSCLFSAASRGSAIRSNLTIWLCLGLNVTLSSSDTLLCLYQPSLIEKVRLREPCLLLSVCC